MPSAHPPAVSGSPRAFRLHARTRSRYHGQLQRKLSLFVKPVDTFLIARSLPQSVPAQTSLRAPQTHPLHSVREIPDLCRTPPRISAVCQSASSPTACPSSSLIRLKSSTSIIRSPHSCSGHSSIFRCRCASNSLRLFSPVSLPASRDLPVLRIQINKQHCQCHKRSLPCASSPQSSARFRPQG